MTRLNQPWPLSGGIRNWLAAGLGAALLIAVLGVFDAALSTWGRGLPAPVVEIAGWITRLGESDYILTASSILFVLAALASVLVPGPPARQALRQVAAVFAFVFAGVGLPGLISAIVKRIIGRARPEFLDTADVQQFQLFSWLEWGYQSFPSGHATTIFALCFTISFLAARAFPWMLLLAVLVALSRVVVGAHFASDIVGGAIVGTLGAYLVRNLFAARGWVFAVREDGLIAMKPLDALMQVFGRR